MVSGRIGDFWRSQGRDPFLRFYTFHKHVQTTGCLLPSYKRWQQTFFHVHLSNIQFCKAQARRITTNNVCHDDKIYAGRVACYFRHSGAKPPRCPCRLQSTKCWNRSVCENHRSYAFKARGDGKTGRHSLRGSQKTQLQGVLFSIMFYSICSGFNVLRSIKIRYSKSRHC